MRKKLFKIALASAGINQAEFARRHKISKPVLTQQLNGKPVSRRIASLITDFIGQEFENIQTILTSSKEAA
ncbi:MAG: hypothetical protein FWE57_04275 [Chitinispirillia bacterium]|nr:hypothetical protein [Chitinispirillia bacterium]